MLADELDYVIGVDTHRDQHTLAVVAAGTGGVLTQTVVPASAGGYATALRFAASNAGGVRVWAIEGGGHYGAGLSRFLADHGETVLEVGRQPRGERRLRQGRHAGCDPGCPDDSGSRDGDAAAGGRASGGLAGASVGSP
jgi:hypothetical protein